MSAPHSGVAVVRAGSRHVNDIVRLLHEEHVKSGFGRFVSYDDDSVRRLVNTHIAANDGGYVFAAIDDGRVVGAICHAMVPFYFNNSAIMSVGLFWVVDPSVRGKGVGGLLVNASNQASKDLGADVIAVQSMPGDGRDTSYKRHGFELTETTWIRRA